MPETDNDIREGLALQEGGKWAEALACYLKAVALNPSDAQALFRAGIALAHERRFDLSGDLLRRALLAEPAFGDAAKALGGVLLLQENYQESAAFLERATVLLPDSATTHCDLGAALVALHQLDKAAASYTRAIVLKPDFAEAHNKLGNIQRHQGELDRAILSYRRAVRADPRHAQAWYNLGVTLQVQEKFPKALEAYEHALALVPDNPGAENNMGLVLKALGRNAEASAAFRRAVALKPDYVLALVNLGAALQVENRPQEAIEILQAALAFEPRDHRAFANLGNAYVALNRPDDGLASYAEALELQPAVSEIRYNVALAHLVKGELEQGWASYESRLDTEVHRNKYPYSTPRWLRGIECAGKTILVYAEQGLGDTLQFVRYLPLMQETQARIIVRVHVALKSLLSGQLGPVEVISTADPLPDHDFVCSLLSLPGAFGTTLDSIPATVPYLKAPEAKTEAWRKVFAHAPGLKVGLVWSGNPKHQFDHNRSVPLELFARITEGVPAHFFSVQKEFRGEDRKILAEMPRIHDLSPKIPTFEDTAALVTALDLVITVDTSVAHLAGALGAKAWVMLGYAPDWRWLLNRTDSPWYPSLRLFRQPALQAWEPVVAEVRTALGALAASAAL